VQHRWITIGATLLTFALGIVGMGKVQQQFFPDSSRPEILVDLWSPEGTSFAANEAVAAGGAAPDAEPGVTSVSTWVGSGVPRFYLPLDQVFPQTNVSQFIVLPKDLKVREALRVRLPALLAQEFPEVRGRVKLLPNGPPVPYPVQFRVVGADPASAAPAADEVKAVMRQSPNTRGVNDNWNESVKVLRLEVDQAKARALGVTSQSIAQASRTMLSGTTVGQYREGDKLIDIVLRQPLDERNAITDLGNAYLPTASGRSIPLTQIAKPVFTWEPGVMWRETATTPSRCSPTSSKACRAPPSPTNCCRSCARWSAKAAAGLPHRGGRRGGGEQQGLGLDRRGRADHAVHHVHAADAAAAQLQPRDAGVPDRAAGHCRRGGRAAAAEPAVRLCRAAGRDCADGHDPAQLGDPDRPDRAGPRGGAGLGRHRRVCSRAAPAPHRADGGRRRAGHDPAVAQVFWGPMAVAIMGGLIVATVLTLLALPAMYAAWFRVRREPTAAVKSAGLTDSGGRSGQPGRPLRFFRARVAKLVDAPGLGPDASNGVGVRVPPRAPEEHQIVSVPVQERTSWP
jgi:multidrug efflux pump